MSAAKTIAPPRMVRPDGTSVDIFMPWYLFGDMTDEELTAIWLYLQAQS